VSKLVKDVSATPSLSGLADELDTRISELKKMRDGAEMDLDLDVTQRMLENDEQDVGRMGEVVNAVSTACTMLEDDNEILTQELEFYEKLLKNNDELFAEEKKINADLISQEKIHKELIKKLN